MGEDDGLCGHDQSAVLRKNSIRVLSHVDAAVIVVGLGPKPLEKCQKTLRLLSARMPSSQPMS